MPNTSGLLLDNAATGPDAGVSPRSVPQSAKIRPDQPPDDAWSSRTWSTSDRPLDSPRKPKPL